MARGGPLRSSPGSTRTNQVWWSPWPRRRNGISWSWRSGRSPFSGWGGRRFADGNDVINCINGNSRMNPVEVFECRFPWLVEEYRLLPDTGGAGRHRGGLSLSKTLRSQGTEITVSFMSDRQKRRPWGLQGGRPAANGSILIERNGTGRWQTFCEAFGKVSPSKFSNATVRPGERVRLTTPGGGGLGDPAARESELIEEDLREGWITPEGARRDYGYRG